MLRASGTPSSKLCQKVGVAKMGFYVVGSAVPEPKPREHDLRISTSEEGQELGSPARPFLELMANCSYKFVPALS